LQDPVAIALDVGARMETIGIDWVIGGSIASSIHGEPRATQDVDMVVALEARHVKSLVQALAPEYYASAEEIRAAA
jgi:hypothetical protein